MSPSLTLVAASLAFVALAAALGARADGDEIVDKATGTKFDELTRVEGHAYKCLGAGVRKLAIVKVYAIAFCVEAAHADGFVRGYLEAHHAGQTGKPLFESENFMEVCSLQEFHRYAPELSLKELKAK